MVFSSTACNLVLKTDGGAIPATLPPRLNVFCRDRSNHTTILISSTVDGLAGGDGDSWPLAVSTNGQFVLFESTAKNLVSHDTNGVSDIFLRNLAGGVTELVSAGTQGDSGNGDSHDAVMTPDGRYIAFVSAATNLVAGDTNGLEDIFVRDRLTGSTVLASVGVTSTNFNEFRQNADTPQITPNGRWVAFFCTMTNASQSLRPAGEVFVRDLLTETTVRASRDAKSLLQTIPLPNQTISSGPHISDDGRYVAFTAYLNTAPYYNRGGLLLRYDLQSEQTKVVHPDTNVPFSRDADVRSFDMTPDGRFIAFIANTNATGYTGDDGTCILRWDAPNEALTLVSGDLNNTVPTRAICDGPVITPDGQHVAFLTSSANLTTNALLGGFHLYLRDLAAGIARLMDVNSNEAGAGVDFTAIPRVSADGTVVAFASASADLVADDKNGARDVFVRDVTSGTTELISERHAALSSDTAAGASGLSLFSANTNARYAAFVSDADGLVSNDSNGLRDVFVRDLLLGSTVLASVATNGQAGNGVSSDPVISGDGQYVAFTSSANNLVAMDNNRAWDVFVRDLVSGTTTLASASSSTNPAYAGRDSFSPLLSADGRYLLFHSYAAYLTINPLVQGIENLYLRDLQAGTNYAITADTSVSGAILSSMTPDGRFVAYHRNPPFLYVWDNQLKQRVYTNYISLSSVESLSLSPDGQRLAYFAGYYPSLYVADRAANSNWLVQAGSNLSYWSPAAVGMHFSDDGRFLTYALAGATSPTDTNATLDVYLYDFLGRTNILVSRSHASPGAANGRSESPAISPDGRFVAFRSAASDLVPGDDNGLPDLFVFDRVNQAMILVSANRDGDAAANNRSMSPVFSADGSSLIFPSWASDLQPDDFNQRSDLFVLRLTPPPITDSDNDGMDDQWEMDYFNTLARDGKDDLDLDGLADGIEFQTGTDPTNALSLFRAELELVNTPTAVAILKWPAKLWGTYRVQFKDDVGDGDWQDLELPVALFGHAGFATDVALNPSHRFYRIVLADPSEENNQ